MKGRTAGLVTLEGPSGNTWHVKLIQQNDDLFLHQGWPEFVMDHFIESGDFLVFRYDGELHFTVQVFDKSSCEKEAAFHSECSQDPGDLGNSMGQKRERDEVASPSDKIFEGVPKKLRGSSSQLHLGCTVKNQEGKVDMYDGEVCKHEVVAMAKTLQEAICPEETRHCGSTLRNSSIASQSKASKEKQVLDIVQFNTKASIQSRNGKEDDLYMHGRICLSMLSAQEVAQSFTSSFPYFVRIMKSFNVSGSYTLNIPYKFSMAHLPNSKIKIVLQNLKGECWTVNSVPTTRVNTSHTLCGGWIAFVRCNDIKVGDICIFELVRECELRVHILGVGREGLDCQNGKVACSRSSGGRAPSSHKTLKVLPKKTKGKSPKASKRRQEAPFSIDVRKQCSASKTYTRAPVGSQSKAANKKLVQRRKVIEDEVGSKTKGSMRMMLALDEERAARSFSSSFPNFVRIMKQFNISGSYTLKIPYQFSTAHLPNCKTEIVLRNLKGKCWTVNSVPDSKGRMGHTFCGGWMAFVRGNDVKIGDICIFELVGKCEMLVHISGNGKKGLDHQSGADDDLALATYTSNKPSL
ncbi:B3 domain-containing protein Os01g0723500 isoform X2 [Quercus suber]